MSCSPPVAFDSTLVVLGTGRGGKAKEEVLRNAALAAYHGKRARKGKPIGTFKASRAARADRGEAG